MIELSVNTEVIIKITCADSTVMQKIFLYNVNDILKIYPKGTKIEILSWRRERIEWKSLISIKSDFRRLIRINYMKTNKFGYEFHIPFDKDFELVNMPKDLIRKSKCSIFAYIVGIGALTGLDNPRIICTNKVHAHTSSLSVFYREKFRILKNNPELYIGNTPVDMEYYVNNFNNSIKDYIELYSTYISEVYLTEKMLENGLLYPLIFSKSFDITEFTDKELYVPYHLNWILWFLYGNEYIIKSKLKYKNEYIDFFIPELSFTRAKENWIIKHKKMRIELDGNFQPIIIANNFPLKLIPRKDNE